MATRKETTRQKLVPAVREPATAKGYPALLAEVKACIQSAQYAALRAQAKLAVKDEYTFDFLEFAAPDAQVRQADESPSIGIILCQEKTRTIVEYALRDARKPIGVATCQITRTLPKRLQDQLPPPEAIARLLETP